MLTNVECMRTNESEQICHLGYFTLEIVTSTFVSLSLATLRYVQGVWFERVL